MLGLQLVASKCSLIHTYFAYIWVDTLVVPSDFRDAENTDGIAESSHKNGIYSLTWNVTEFVKVWMN